MNPINQVAITSLLSPCFGLGPLLCGANILTDLFRLCIDNVLKEEENQGLHERRPQTASPTHTPFTGRGQTLGNGGDAPASDWADAVRGRVEPRTRSWSDLMPTLPTISFPTKESLRGLNNKTQLTENFYLGSAFVASALAIIALSLVTFALQGALPLSFGGALCAMGISCAVTGISTKLGELLFSA